MTDNKTVRSSQAPAPAGPPPGKIAVESTGYFYARAAEEGGAAAPLLVGLHGFAQTGPGFLEITAKMAGPGMAAVAPQGFNQIWDPKTHNIYFSWMTSFEKEDSIRRNNAFVRGVIEDAVRGGGIDAGSVFLMGFSQGSSVAYRFAKEHPDLVRGVISVCADMPPDVIANPGGLKRVPVLIAYGTQDQLIPAKHSLEAFDALKRVGVETEITSFERGHLVPSSLAPKVREWMLRVRAGRRG